MNKKTKLFIFYVLTLIISLLGLVILKLVCKIEDIKLIDNFTTVYVSVVLSLGIVAVIIWIIINRKDLKFWGIRKL